MSRSRLSRCDRGEDLAGDVLQRVEQEVHRPIRPVVGERGQALDRDPLSDPLRAGELAARLQRTLRDQRNHDPLDRCAVQAPTGRGFADRRADPELLPDAVQRPRPTQATGVDDLDVTAAGRSRGLLGGEEPRDRAHQPGQRGPVDLLRPPEVVDHLRHRAAGLRMPLVVRELQVRHHRAVPVAPSRLPQVHTYTSPHERLPRSATRPKSCAYKNPDCRTTNTPLTCANAVDQGRICLPAAELRSVPGIRASSATWRRKALWPRTFR